MREFFFFDTLILPKIITFIYWLGIFSAVIAAFTRMFGGYGGFSIGSFFGGIFVCILGILGSRLWCELIIVAFKINENLEEIRKK